MRRAFDPLSVLEDGLGFGRKIEDSQFNFDPTWGVNIGTEARLHREWRHSTSGLQMSVNPKFYIIEVPTVDPHGVISTTLFEEGPENPGGQLIQLYVRRLNLLGLASGQVAELQATHRLRLTLSEFSGAIGLRARIL